MIALSEFLAAQPILSLFLAVALGYAVGQINIAGFSLGIGAVLFVGLAIGALVPKAQIIGPIGLIEPHHVPVRNPASSTVGSSSRACRGLGGSTMRWRCLS